MERNDRDCLPLGLVSRSEDSETFCSEDTSVNRKIDSVREEFDGIPAIHRNHTFESSSENSNKRKNRYYNILPCDETRVRLIDRNPVDDYINANFISFDKYWAICTQAPMVGLDFYADTSLDFWEMIFTYRCPAIFMLTRLFENNRSKAELYWPTAINDIRQFGDIKVRIVDYFEICGIFRVSEFKLIRGNDENDNNNDENKEQCHTVFHIFYQGWPDHGVPKTPDDFFRMLEFWDIFSRMTDNPVVLHCSAGVGRTGTLASAKMYQVTRRHPKIIIEELRQQRPQLVQSLEQYKFLLNCCDGTLSSMT